MLNSRCFRIAGRYILRSIALLSICLGLSEPLAAQEPVQQFLEGLRQRGYFDTCIEYIAQQEQNPNLDDTLKESLGFEKAMTYLGMSRQARTSGAKAKALTQAQGALQQFAQQFPRNARAAKANYELGNILFERARTKVWQSESPPPGQTKAGLRGEARVLINEARQIYKKAYDLSKNRLAGLRPPAASDGDKEEDQLYLSVLTSKISNALQLAKCLYEEGQTYDRGSEKRREKLIAASEEFRKIHEEYRTWIGGLTARLWQGRCFEELDDVSTALGIYSELLAKKIADIREFQAKATRFKFICLNHEKKKDYEIVINKAGEWLTDKGNSARSEDGVGIRWQKARAHDLFGHEMGDENPERKRQLRLALSEATDVSRFETPYKNVAGAMVRRLKVELGDRQGPPKSFDTAFELARTNIRKLSAFKAAAQSASSKQDRQKAREDLTLTLQSVDELLNNALQLADDKVEPAKKFMAQYLLAFVKYEQRNSLDAIVLARHVMRFAAKEAPETAMNAGDVAMTAGIQAFNDAGTNNQFEMQLLESISNQIITEWPTSERANEARMSLGMINNKSGDAEAASNWYSKVPRTAPQFGEAQLAAGQSWLKASLAAGNKDVGEVDPNQIVEMTKNAETYLRSGLKATFNPAGKPPDTVTAGKLSLAQILNSRGEFPEAIKLLTDGQQSVLNEIAVADQTKRPAEGVKNKDFASLAYSVLLRAYVGTQQIDQALSAMSEMEKIGGPDTQIYVQLGQELEREIDRLKLQNDTERLKQLRSSFEEFLSKVFERKNRQNYNSLIWVGETYRGLGMGLNDDPTAAEPYFQRAAESYQRILDQNLVDARRKTTVELRLVACRRAVKDFDGAMKRLREIVGQHPTDMTAQFEACYLLTEWGKNGQPEKLSQALKGSEDKKLWGWFGLSTRLAANPNFRERFFEARYGRIEAQRDYAMVGEPGKKTDRLNAAKRDIELLISTQDTIEDSWWNKFNGIYQTLQRDLGQQPVALEKPEQFVPVPVQQKKTEVAEATPPPGVADTPVAKEPESNSLLGLALALPIALLAVGGMWFAMAKPRKKPATAAISQGPAPSFDGIGVAAPVSQKLPSGPGTRKQAAGPTRKKKATAKRQLTPEEAAKRKALIAKKRAAQAAQGADPTAAKKKITVKKKPADAAARPATGKKKVVRKAPKKPPEAS